MGGVYVNYKGSGLMASPVMEQGANHVQMYLPGANTVSDNIVCYNSVIDVQIWYEFDTYTATNGGRRHQLSTPLSKVTLRIALTEGATSSQAVHST